MQFFALYEMPNKPFIWDEAMMTAAADVNPPVTGIDTNSTTKPERRKSRERIYIHFVNPAKFANGTRVLRCGTKSKRRFRFSSKHKFAVVASCSTTSQRTNVGISKSGRLPPTHTHTPQRHQRVADGNERRFGPLARVPRRKMPQISSTIPDTKHKTTAVVGNSGLM